MILINTNRDYTRGEIPGRVGPKVINPFEFTK